MKFIICILPALCFNLLSLGQDIERSVISPNGSSFQNSSVTVSQTVGELVINSFSNSSVSVLEGFQQNSPLTTGSIERSLLSDIKIFPNPTTDMISIQVKSQKSVALSIELRDLQGKLIETKGFNVTANIMQSESLDFTNLSSGLYLISLVSENTIIDEAKVVKK